MKRLEFIIPTLVAILLFTLSVAFQGTKAGVAIGTSFLVFVIILAITTCFFAFRIIKVYGRIVGNAVIYLVLAIFSFSAIYPYQFFLILSGVETGFTIVLWEHLIFYIGMVLFFTAVNKINKHDSNPIKKGILSQKDKINIGIFVMIFFFLVILVIPLSPYSSSLAGTFIDTSQMLHIIAFVLAFFVAREVNKMKSSVGKTLSSSVGSLFLAILFLGLIHFWETLIGNLKVSQK